MIFFVYTDLVVSIILADCEPYSTIYRYSWNLGNVFWHVFNFHSNASYCFHIYLFFNPCENQLAFLSFKLFWRDIMDGSCSNFESSWCFNISVWNFFYNVVHNYARVYQWYRSFKWRNWLVVHYFNNSHVITVHSWWTWNNYYIRVLQRHEDSGQTTVGLFVSDECNDCLREYSRRRLVDLSRQLCHQQKCGIL